MQLVTHMVLCNFCEFFTRQYGPWQVATLSWLQNEEVHAMVPLERKHTRGVEEDCDLFQDCELLKEADAGCDAVWQFADADWWNWMMGSAFLFWCWGEGKQRRFPWDGMEVFITGKLP